MVACVGPHMRMQTPMHLLAPEQREARPGDTLDVEVRFSAVGDDGAIEGRAVKFNVTDTYKTEFAEIRSRTRHIRAHRVDALRMVEVHHRKLHGSRQEFR